MPLIDVDFQLHVMDSGGKDSVVAATIAYELSTPCNGFDCLIPPGSSSNVSFQLHVMDSTTATAPLTRSLPNSTLSTPCNGFLGRSFGYRGKGWGLSTPCNGFLSYQ